MQSTLLRRSALLLVILLGTVVPGCGEPAQPAPAPGATGETGGAQAAKPATPTAPVTPAQPAVPSAEQQAFAYVKLLRGKLEAKDYAWVYNNALPPDQAAAHHAKKPLEEFVREFGDKGEAKILLNVLNTVEEDDCEVDGNEGTRVTVRWKDSWEKKRDLVFIKVADQWYLGN